MFIFQSIGRSHDLPIAVNGVKSVVSFTNYRFVTESKDIAEAVRKNVGALCGIFEISAQEKPEIVDDQEVDTVIVDQKGTKEKRARPAGVKTSRGARLADT